MGHIAGTGHEYRLSLEVNRPGPEHILQEIHIAVSSRFRTDEGSAECLSLPRQYAGKLVRQLLVLAEHIAYLTSSHTDVAGRNIAVRTDVMP